MPLLARSFRYLGETPPRHPPAVPPDFTPPPSSPRFDRFIDRAQTADNHRSSYSPTSKDRESGKDDEKKEDFAPYPSLTESRASSSSAAPFTIIRQKTRIEDEHRTSFGMFSREDSSDKDADLLPYDEAADEAAANPADEMDDIAMSPIPFDREDREDPTTLMELPENLLSLPISPCGPHDDPSSQ
jgi:hypothetical protein